MNSEHLQMWLMGRKRLTGQLDEISEVDLLKRLHSDSNSVGWLLRHIAEVELLFSKNVFGKKLMLRRKPLEVWPKITGSLMSVSRLWN